MNPRQQLRQRSLQSLAHPISIAAIVLLLVNDHWLRWHYPSWWSGKIGDFAWLIFAPFLLAFCLSYVWPTQNIHQAVTVTFICTGVLFALGNSVPLFHQIIVWLFQQIAGWKPLMVLDPTDLLMLPAILVGWKIWQTCPPRFESVFLPLEKHTLGWILLSIGALGTMANTPSIPDFGVQCVTRQGQTVLAVTNSEAGWFESDDGGLTWTQVADIERFPNTPCEREFVPLEILDPNNSNHLWRIGESAEFIEQSYDGGNSWQAVYEFPSGEQVRQYYYRPEPLFFSRVDNRPGGPYNGIVEPVTGNLIVSMGFEGVIVITPTGEVNRVVVGPYSFVDIHELKLTEMLKKELFLALILGFLVISMASIPLWTEQPGRTAFLVFLVFGTFVWLVYTLFFREFGILTLISLLVGFGPLALFVLFFYAVLAGLGVQKIRERYSWQFVGQLLTIAMITGFLFIIPLVFWAGGIVPSYQFVINLAIVLTLLPVGYSYDLVSKKKTNNHQN